MKLRALLLALLCLIAGAVSAHEVRPAYLELRQTGGKALSALSPGNLLLDSLGSAGAYLRSSGTLQKFVIMLIAKKFLK